MSLNDPQPIETLYANHHPWLKAWLARRLGCSQEADDISHDSFLRLLLKPRRFASDSDARAFLCTVARGLSIDRWRRRNIERAWLETLAAQPESFAASAERQAILAEALCEIDTMLRSLPEKARTVFLLAQIHGYGYREIAARLDISERMVKKYMARVMLQCALLEAGLYSATES
ncbi:sigma-70 family RNA polymerase sigma factor [Stutzerimonas kirkiae]|uniref:RNA polymerase subunit sigma n=1 Tax=Stutzerimonas kirkiae TaxID=2211392 RepID=A0A4Q9R7H8_9GAMM|nr:sigma-70 family RNA polymerase sigma factor [Stutzerimonas kirkiae]TBU96525.1 RNA polymerase subunit sigma [Stutzerimonas kirkiae]TBV02192.1 RNA polymerase subunit sigma [Stutzerimonas kirkiae]TBV08861.1 RNA polymerase subunit sigma [Stutzerimonas kirkiae]TBV15697.1 RNA polymerase subunit sigma [Stutzerimonas kirkiae]